MARRARKATPPYGLCIGLVAVLICLILGGILQQAAPLSVAEAMLWDAAQSQIAPFLWAEPLAVALTWLMQALLGDTILALRFPALLAVPLMAVVLIRSAPAKARRTGVISALLVLSSPVVVWSAFRSGADLMAVVALTAALITGLTAGAPPRRKKDPERWGAWALTGVLAASAAALSIWTLAPLLGALVGFTLGDQRHRWRGALFAAGLALLLLVPWGLFLAATGFVPLVVFLGPVEVTGLIWLLALGPLLLGLFAALRGGLGGALIGCILSVLIAVATGRDALGPVLMIAPILAIAAGPMVAGWTMPRLSATLVPGLAIGVAVLLLGSVHARYATGLPAGSDPFAQDRFTGARCEAVLITLEDFGASALVSRRLEEQVACRWLGALTDMPIVLTHLPVGTSPQLRARFGPLALEDRTGLMISHPPVAPQEIAAPLLQVEFTEHVRIPLHIEREQEIDLSSVSLAR